MSKMEGTEEKDDVIMQDFNQALEKLNQMVAETVAAAQAKATQGGGVAKQDKSKKGPVHDLVRMWEVWPLVLRPCLLIFYACGGTASV